MINIKKIVTVGALFVLLAQLSAMQAMELQLIEHQLHDACYKGDTSTVESLLEAGVDVNATNDYGETPLYFACIEGHIEVARLLLATNRVDVNAKIYNKIIPVDNDVTPLFLACRIGCIKLIKLLLINGAQIVDKTLNSLVDLPVIFMSLGIYHISHRNIPKIEQLMRKVYEFQHSENKLEFILKHIQNDQEEDPEDKKELVKIVCSASFMQMLKGKIQIEEAIFYQLHQYAPDILSQIFEVESLQVDNLMDCIIEKKDPCFTKQKQEKDPCLAEQMQEKYLCLTEQMQERLAEYKNLLINTSERFEFLKQQCTKGGTPISTNDRELKIPSFLGLQVVSPLLVEEIEEEEEGE